MAGCHVREGEEEVGNVSGQEAHEKAKSYMRLAWVCGTQGKPVIRMGENFDKESWVDFSSL